MEQNNKHRESEYERLDQKNQAPQFSEMLLSYLVYTQHKKTITQLQ